MLRPSKLRVRSRFRATGITAYLENGGTIGRCAVGWRRAIPLGSARQQWNDVLALADGLARGKLVDELFSKHVALPRVRRGPEGLFAE